MSRRHVLRFYSEKGNLNTYTLSEKSQIERWKVYEAKDWNEKSSDYNHHQRWGYHPRFMLAFRMLIGGNEDFCMVATLSELAQRGYKFSFAFDSNETSTGMLASSAGIDDTELDLTGQWTRGDYIRIIGEGGYRSGTNSLEQDFPGFYHMDVVKVIDTGPLFTTIDPPLIHEYKSGARVSQHRYFESCLMTDDSLVMTRVEGKWYWVWEGKMALQRPSTLTFPAW